MGNVQSNCSNYRNSPTLPTDLDCLINNTVTELTMFKPDGIVRVQASFHDYAEINGQSIPESIQIHWPDTNTTLTLDLNNIIINEPLKPEIFQFKKPKRAEIVEIN